jgi:hypothetical protein
VSDVRRYDIDENGVCTHQLDGAFVSYDDYASLHYERIHDLNQIGGLQEENARLKAEVERLTKAGDAMASSIQFNEEMAQDYNGPTIVHQSVQRWNAAKEGKQP